MKTKAFTLAEVLITFGIIGIVAAMTLPGLMNKLHGYVLEMQFKRAYNQLSQALLKMKNDYEIDNFNKEFAVYDSVNKIYPRRKEFTNNFYKTLGTKNISVTYKKTVRNYTLSKNIEQNKSEDFAVPDRILSNGTTVKAVITSAHILLYIDINGYKNGPNAFGHDIFRFDVANDNSLKPLKMKKEYTADDDLTDVPYPEQAGYPCSVKSIQKGNGIGCAWYAFFNVSPADSHKTYWDNLPKK